MITVASTADPSVMTKYKQGYSECVQECMRFMDTNGKSIASQETRQSLITNLMRQFQSINPTASHNEQLILPGDESQRFRRSSVSPITSSSCSSSLSGMYFNLDHSSSSSSSSSSTCDQGSFESYNEQTTDKNAESLPCSPKLLDTSEINGCWRPW